ncbi:transcriptional regulator, TetR family [Thermosyntropha lipolytica DSM 11003]|uniref:Transcriptional regulator, TetR family n=1 Tax=Thermosyntropha lipolytica DSM 11003 TaxID=1123382 RepID=A0A1M5QNG8_9FIRM|nr:TetR/AcrR family transcriptional regulator [Thermosyntropha lipolytica]SHH15526.1 transcriptional regulator, TetR family [Thermosyntropha lipolytica DSM 11003]
METDKKEIQRHRMMTCFIDAAVQIIEEEGIKGVTARKVADLAGYNVATLYNYFSNLDHLILFAALRFMREYTESLPFYVYEAKNALERFLKIWECFCYYSFGQTEIYNAIFFTPIDEPLPDIISQYYELFPQDLSNQPEELLPMLTRTDIYERDKVILEACAREGFIRYEDIDEINEIILLIYQGMLSGLISKRFNYTQEEAVEKTMFFIKKCLHFYLIDREKVRL